MLNVVATLVVDYFVWYCAFWNWRFYSNVYKFHTLMSYNCYGARSHWGLWKQGHS